MKIKMSKIESTVFRCTLYLTSCPESPSPAVSALPLKINDIFLQKSAHTIKLPWRGSEEKHTFFPTSIPFLSVQKAVSPRSYFLHPNDRPDWKLQTFLCSHISHVWISRLYIPHSMVSHGIHIKCLKEAQSLMHYYGWFCELVQRWLSAGSRKMLYTPQIVTFTAFLLALRQVGPSESRVSKFRGHEEHTDL